MVIWNPRIHPSSSSLEESISYRIYKKGWCYKWHPEEGLSRIYSLWLSSLSFASRSHAYSRSCFFFFLFHTHSKSLAISAAAKSLHLCPTLCDPIDSSPPGSPIPGILQARTLEWVAISISNAWKWKVKVKSLSRVRLLATPWTAAYQAPLSMGFSGQEYWGGVPLPSPLSLSLDHNLRAYISFLWCCNNLPHGAFKTTEIYSLIVLEDGSSKSLSLGWDHGVSSAKVPLGAFEIPIYYCPLPALLTASGPWLIAASLWCLHWSSMALPSVGLISLCLSL